MLQDIAREKWFRRVEDMLEYLERQPKRLHVELRRYRSSLDWEQQALVFSQLADLVRRAPDEAWRAFASYPPRSADEYHDDERLISRLVPGRDLYGVDGRRLKEVLWHLEDATTVALGEGDQRAHAAFAQYLSLMVEVIAFLIRYRPSYLQVVHSASAPSALRAPRPCIRPPGEGGKPVLRLIKSCR